MKKIICIPQILFLLTVWGFAGCEKASNELKEEIIPCKETQNLDKIKLTTLSNEYFHYDNIDTMIFKNKDGVSIVFIKTESIDLYPYIYFYKPCEQNDSTLFVFSEQNKKVIFHSDYRNTDIYLYHSVLFKFLPRSSLDINLYDVLTVGMRTSSESGYSGTISLQLLTDDRSNVEIVDSLNIDNPEFQMEKQLIDTIYHNVFFVDHTSINYGIGPKELNYTKEIGIVGFRDNERDLWVLKDLK